MHSNSKIRTIRLASEPDLGPVEAWFDRAKVDVGQVNLCWHQPAGGQLVSGTHHLLYSSVTTFSLLFNDLSRDGPDIRTNKPVFLIIRYAAGYGIWQAGYPEYANGAI